MSLINCPDCDKEVSTMAKHCPHCGCPISEREFITGQKNIYDLAIVSEKKCLSNVKTAFIFMIISSGLLLFCNVLIAIGMDNAMQREGLYMSRHSEQIWNALSDGFLKILATIHIGSCLCYLIAFILLIYVVHKYKYNLNIYLLYTMIILFALRISGYDEFNTFFDYFYNFAFIAFIIIIYKKYNINKKLSISLLASIIVFELFFTDIYNSYYISHGNLLAIHSDSTTFTRNLLFKPLVHVFSGLFYYLTYRKIDESLKGTPIITDVSS